MSTHGRTFTEPLALSILSLLAKPSVQRQHPSCRLNCRSTREVRGATSALPILSLGMMHQETLRSVNKLGIASCQAASLCSIGSSASRSRSNLRAAMLTRLSAKVSAEALPLLSSRAEIPLRQLASPI